MIVLYIVYCKVRASLIWCILCYIVTDVSFGSVLFLYPYLDDQNLYILFLNDSYLDDQTFLRCILGSVFHVHLSLRRLNHPSYTRSNVAWCFRRHKILLHNCRHLKTCRLRSMERCCGASVLFVINFLGRTDCTIIL